MVKISLRLLKGTDENSLRIEIVDINRITFHGFGCFLENYSPMEIEIAEPVRQKLLTLSYRGGVQKLEFFGHNLLGWVPVHPEVAFDDVSVHGETAKEHIRRFSPV